MSKIELEIVGLSASQSQSGSFAMVLGEKFGNRRLPIIIGMFEAQAIAIELESIKSKRPMTHDLFKSLSVGFGIEVLEIVIDDIKEGVFYSKIWATNGEETLEFDSRPSDAIALAVRFGVPIYTNDVVLSEAGVEPSELSGEIEEELLESELESVLSDSEDLEEEGIAEITLEDLHLLLDKALASENYEEAARLRDEINKRS